MIFGAVLARLSLRVPRLCHLQHPFPLGREYRLRTGMRRMAILGLCPAIGLGVVLSMAAGSPVAAQPAPDRQEAPIVQKSLSVGAGQLLSFTFKVPTYYVDARVAAVTGAGSARRRNAARARRSNGYRDR